MKEIRMEGGNALGARTKDGLLMTMTLSFQYQLKITLENVVDWYYKWGASRTHDAFARMSRTVLRDAVSEYVAIDMFKNRTSKRC
jgi:hypothetical protein